jgi:hypothetical protein
MKSFIEFWKEHGQAFGFILLIVILIAYSIVFYDEMRTNNWATFGWLIIFFGGATFLGLQGRRHGWKLPKNIRDTH